MRTTQLTVLDVAAVAEPRRPAGRLVVLVPRRSADDLALTSVVDRFTVAGDRPVVFVGMAESVEEEAHLRHRLEALEVEAREIRVVRTGDWSAAIDAVRQDGDVIVFPTSVAPAIPAAPTASVRTETRPHPRRRPGRLIDYVLEWGGPLLIVLSFFLVQVRLDQALTGLLHHALVLASVVAEIAVLWRWEQWFSGRLVS